MTWSTSAMSAAARARELGGDEEEVTRRKRLDAPGQAHGGRNGSPTRRIIGRPVGGPVSALAPGGAPGMIRHKIRCAARRGIRRTMAPQRAPPHLAAPPRRPMAHLATAAPPLSLAIVGAGPAGLSLALQAALALPEARVTVFDARPAHLAIAHDAPTLALSLGTVQELGRIGVWDAIARSGRQAPILEVHVSQQQPTVLWPGNGQPEVSITAREQGVPQLGAVVSYGTLVAPLQAAWLEAVTKDEHRLAMRFGTPVRGFKRVAHGTGQRIEVDADIAEDFDLVVVAEGGVFADQPKLQWPEGLSHDYEQTAWVGQVRLDASAQEGAAYERFTPSGPAALLPLPPGPVRPGGESGRRGALVRGGQRKDDPAADGAGQHLPRPRGPHPGGLAAQGLPAGAQRPHAAGQRGSDRAHRQRGADAAPGGRPGVQPGHARRARVAGGPEGTGLGPRGRRRHARDEGAPGPATVRASPSARPAGAHGRDRFPGAQLHVASAHPGDGAGAGAGRGAATAAHQAAAGAQFHVRLALRGAEGALTGARTLGGLSARPAWPCSPARLERARERLPSDPGSGTGPMRRWQRTAGVAAVSGAWRVSCGWMRSMKAS